MLHRGDRQHHAHHRRHLVAAVAAGIDDVFAGDRAVRGFDRPIAAGRLAEAGHWCVAVNLGTGLAGASR